MRPGRTCSATLLLHAFPDRIARQSPNDPRRYQLANGRSARLFDDSALYGEPWIVISELRDGAPSGAATREAQILRAAPLDEARLPQRVTFPERFVESDSVRWDADKRVRWCRAAKSVASIAIVLESKLRRAASIPHARGAGPVPMPCASSACPALPWSDALAQWRARVRCLRAWMPELALADLSDDALLASRDDWLKPALAGKTRLDALDEVALADALKSRLDWNARQRIDALAPVRIHVPSGMERPIAYGYDDPVDAPEPPVLAVKLQELFGLADTPRIADGRVALTLHLLSPGGKPLQCDPRPARVLGAHLPGCAQGNERAVSATSMAGGSVGGNAHAPGKAAGHVRAGRARERGSRLGGGCTIGAPGRAGFPGARSGGFPFEPGG